MANRANTTTASTVAALHAEATARAEAMKLTAHLLAERLRDVMQEIHGGEWRIQIDHEVELLMIVPRLERPILPPRTGESV